MLIRGGFNFIKTLGCVGAIALALSSSAKAEVPEINEFFAPESLSMLGGGLPVSVEALSLLSQLSSGADSKTAGVKPLVSSKSTLQLSHHVAVPQLQTVLFPGEKRTKEWIRWLLDRKHSMEDSASWKPLLSRSRVGFLLVGGF